jgi:hypothetical protein
MMNRQLANQLSKEVEDALQAVARRHGLTVTCKGGGFDNSMFKPRVEFKTAGADRADFTNWAPLVGLRPEDFGRTFEFNGHVYTIEGIRPRAMKNVIARRANGKAFVFPARTVLQELRRSAISDAARNEGEL